MRAPCLAVRRGDTVIYRGERLEVAEKAPPNGRFARRVRLMLRSGQVSGWVEATEVQPTGERVMGGGRTKRRAERAGRRRSRLADGGPVRGSAVAMAQHQAAPRLPRDVPEPANAEQRRAELLAAIRTNDRGRIARAMRACFVPEPDAAAFWSVVGEMREQAEAQRRRT